MPDEYHVLEINMNVAVLASENTGCSKSRFTMTMKCLTKIIYSCVHIVLQNVVTLVLR
jgi:hypothetical protein